MFRSDTSEMTIRHEGDACLAGLRICIVLAALGAGGAERVVAWLANHLTDRGAAVTIVSFDSPTDPIFHDFGNRMAFIRLDIPVKGSAGKRLPAPIRRTVALRGVLHELAPDIAIGFLTKINALLLAATLGMRIPVLVSERNNPHLQPAHWAWKYALPLLYGRATGILCQTQASTICIAPPWRKRVTVIPNPVALTAVPSRSRWNGAAFRIAGVGRLEHQKGFDILIRAFAKIAAERPEWNLDIWGQGPDLTALQALRDELGMAHRVAFRGLSLTPGGWVAETDLFVLASRYEGFPNVLGEAMAAGLPVIATNCDFGPSELVDGGHTGLLVPPDDITAMAAALAQLTGDGDLRTQLGSAAVAVTRRFSPDAVARMWRQAIVAAVR
ncbi:conserved hypothetical protein [Altererythrobacter sp. B11]|uniref:glycosyltransferase family 4 protein n=1 Tax=Altererythrobacter sp. B11 TaxID=2060312 RepID=UPI000DC7333C|nr:glycosyltransferase family 4 protein [Altererythrobacter sp. B11]BBC72703.1 conserved hypothetical protein [Altererythrobacter sp. B11]